MMSCYVIEKDKLIKNINIVKEKAGVPVIGVVKGNGYGFGICEMAKILKENGIKTFAITEVYDIPSLKSVLDDEDILMLRSATDEDEAKIIANTHCIATIGSTKACEVMNNVSKKLGVKTRCHLKIDTGLGRYGFLPSEVDKMIECYKSENLEFCGAYTHFSHAFCDINRTKQEFDLFMDIINQLKKAGINPGCLHAANSPALFNFTNVSLDAVRIGSAFTGRVNTFKPNPLVHVGLLESNVIDIKTVPRGSTVGYGGTFTAKKDTTLAIIPMGHEDGFGIIKARVKTSFVNILSDVKHWLKGDNLKVMINSIPYPVAGNIGLTHTAVYIGNSDVHIGDKVTVDISPLMVNPIVPKKYI